MRKRLFNILRIVISLSLLAFLIFRNRNNFNDILDALREINIYYLAAALAAYFIAISLIVFRWGFLLRAHDYIINHRFLWQSTLIGFFYNNLLPTSVGGDFYRVYDIKQNKDIPVNAGIASVVMERIIGSVSSFTLLVISYFLGLFDYLERSAALGLLISIVVIIIFFVILFFPGLFGLDRLIRKFRIFAKIRPRLKEFHEILIGFRHKKKHVFISYIFAMTIQGFFLLSYYLISVSLNMKIAFYIFIFIIPFVSIVSSIPISIGGIGIRENALVFVLAVFGAVQSGAMLFSLILLAIILIIGFTGGIVYLVKNLTGRSKGFI